MLLCDICSRASHFASGSRASRSEASHEAAGQQHSAPVLLVDVFWAPSWEQLAVPLQAGRPGHPSHHHPAGGPGGREASRDATQTGWAFTHRPGSTNEQASLGNIYSLHSCRLYCLGVEEGELRPQDNGEARPAASLAPAFRLLHPLPPARETSGPDCCSEVRRMGGGRVRLFGKGPSASSGDGRRPREGVGVEGRTWGGDQRTERRKRDPGVIRFATSRNTVSHCVSLHPCPPPRPETRESYPAPPPPPPPRPPPPQSEPPSTKALAPSLPLSLQAIASGVESIPEHNAYTLNGCFSMPPVRCHQQMGS